jgi:hypothetical protein
MDDQKIAACKELIRRRTVEFDALRDHWRRIHDIREVLPKPKGLFTKRCPYDKAKLTIIKVAIDILYQCPNCDYEYTLKNQTSE